MTIWHPDIARISGPRYLAIVAALEEDIGLGRVTDGARLPTHRDLAFRLGVTVGTVTRAYADAARLGLVRGEVGRGTFVRAARRQPPPFVERAGDDLIDLSRNFAARSDSDALLANTLRGLATDGPLGHLLDYQAHRGRFEHRAAGAAWVARHGLEVSPDQIVLTSGGQHAMAVLLGTLAGPGDTVLCEALTYPGVKALADLFRFNLVGVALDEHGMIPEAFDEACLAHRPKALFCMPSLHNPTGAHMPEERRRAVAAIARRHRVRIVEDDIYGFLVEGGPAPLVSHAPELGYYLVSLSKSMAPGLRVSYAVVPRDQVPAIAASVHATAYMTAPLMAEIAARWIGDGTGARLVETYRREAIVRQVLTREALRGFTYAAHPAGFHGILTLPEPWSPTAFVTELRQRGVVLSPSTAFAAGPTAPAFVRLCLACTQERDELTYALRIVADLAKETPQAHLAVV